MQERLWFDLKRTYPPSSQTEKAKDIAAFANASGGAIIVGADEGIEGPDYGSPLSVDYASKVESEFDQAVRDYCRPSPTVHTRTIPVPTQPGSVLVVVNVEPAIDQPVAARYGADPHTWRFPQRVGRHTEYILPEQLPLLMNSRARRTKLLLLRTVADGGEIDLFTIPGGTFARGTIQASSLFVVSEVDRAGSGAFTIHDPTGDLGPDVLDIPLDDVDAVWKQRIGRWAVRLSGRVELLFGEGNARELVYIPPGTFVASPVARAIEDISKGLKELRNAIGGKLTVEHHSREEPDHQAIAVLAHKIWRQRVEGRLSGTPEEDWAKARGMLLTGRRLR